MSAIINIGRMFCNARREGDQSDGGCPVLVWPDAPEPICPRCREDAERAIRVARTEA